MPTMITGSLVAIVTPMHEDGRLDFGGFKKLIDWHAAEGTDGIVVVGTKVLKELKYVETARTIEGTGWAFDQVFTPLKLGQGHRAALPHRLHRAQSLLAQDALNPADGVAVAVEQMPNTAQKIDILRAIIAPAAAALHRLDVGKAALPEPQHMLRQIELVCDLADRPECVGRLVQSRLLLWVLHLTAAGAVRTRVDAQLENR